MQKVLFVIPPYISYERFTNPTFIEKSVEKKSGTYADTITDMPLGVLSLSAYLKAYADVETRMVDFNILLSGMDEFSYPDFKTLYEDILSSDAYKQFQPDIVGLSVLFTPAFNNFIELAETVKNVFPNAVTVGGGIVTTLYEEIFSRTDALDALCYGEGEKPLLELIRAKNKPDLLHKHPAWITPFSCEKKITPQYDFINDLDEIPTYDYSMLSADDYAKRPTLGNYASFKNSQLLFHVSTSRGCPYRCTFCASHAVHGRKMRYHSAKRVLEDFRYLVEHHGATTLVVQDDHFMGDKQRAREIIEGVCDMNAQLYFQSGLSIRALDRSMLELIKKAGINELVIPIESGSKRVLKEIMRKPINLDMVHQVISDCRDLQIESHANILVGLPGETKEDIEDSRKFLRSTDATWYRFFIATPLVGSDMLKTCQEKGYVKDNYFDSDFKKAVIETEAFSAEYITDKSYALNLELNFVYNSDYRLGDYSKALSGFENTLRLKGDHAFAWYFAAQCYEKLDNHDTALSCRQKYFDIVASDALWSRYAKEFDLPLTPQTHNNSIWNMNKPDSLPEVDSKSV